MNYLTQLFPWFHPQGHITSNGPYCVECTTNAGLPGAKFCPGCSCRQGYGCSGGAIRTNATVLSSRYSSYSQAQLNSMVDSIATLQKKYYESVKAYNDALAVYNQWYNDYGNCDCSNASCSQHHPCICQPGNVPRQPQNVGSCPGASPGTGRYNLEQKAQLRNAAKTTMDTNKGLLDKAQADYNTALAQFEREITANMTPAQRTAYESAKAEQARKDAAAANRIKLYKWAGVTVLALGTGFLLVWGGKKMFAKKAPLVVKAAA